MTDQTTACSEFDPNCPECVSHREEAFRSDVPQSIREVFAQAIEKMDRGYFQWIHNNSMLQMVIYPAIIWYRVLTVGCFTKVDYLN